MPELPEVETFARMLHVGTADSPSVIGRTIASADVLWHKTLAEPSEPLFTQRLAGNSILQVDRRGKYLHFRLQDSHLLIHLRMSGEIIVSRHDGDLGTHPRLVIYFEDGYHMSFSDARKFGRVWLVDDPGSIIGGLGPEPLSPALTPAHFSTALRSRKRLIKPLLLDQTFIAGIGNIYADESLHLAKIHPLTRSDLLSPAQAKDLLLAVRKVLRAGIKTNGASIDWVYRGGGYQNHFRAYGRSGELCEVCHTPIERITVAQRGTYFCPGCQVPPPRA